MQPIFVRPVSLHPFFVICLEPSLSYFLNKRKPLSFLSVCAATKLNSFTCPLQRQVYSYCCAILLLSMTIISTKKKIAFCDDVQLPTCNRESEIYDERPLFSMINDYSYIIICYVYDEVTIRLVSKRILHDHSRSSCIWFHSIARIRYIVGFK